MTLPGRGGAMAACVLTLALAIALPVQAAAAKSESAEQVVAMNLAARGGLARLKRVQTERLIGTLSFAPGDSTPFRVELARGGKIREEIGVPGGTLFEIGDGQAGWVVSPRDSGMMHDLGAAELRNLAASADFDGPLVDAATRGNRIELIGREPVSGRDTWHLHITQRDSTVRDDYIDCQTHLEVKWAGTVGDGKSSYRVESFFSDIRSVNGVMIAHHIESNTLGTPVHQVLSFSSVEVDVPIDPVRFSRPASSAFAR